MTVLDPTGGLRVSVSPTMISANQSYTLTVTNPDGTPYEGYLDYDMLACPLGDISPERCAVTHGPWGTYLVKEGKLVINIENADGMGTQIPDGIVIARFRPHGSSGVYSNQIGYVIDRKARPVADNAIYNSGRYLIPRPVEGAYAIYEDLAHDGTLNGYTRVEFERASDPAAGLIQRFTKSASYAYWGPSRSPEDPNISTLRWRIGPSTLNSDNFKAFTGIVARFDANNATDSSLANTRYPEPQIGNLGRIGALVVENTYSGPSDLFYTLAPVHLFAETLSDSFGAIIDRLVSYNPEAEALNNWHVEARASALGGIYELRYIEWALGVANLSANPQFASIPSASVADWNLRYRWNVLEDWDWNADGTLNRITQLGNTYSHTTIGPTDLPPDCWTIPGGCDKPIKHYLRKLRAYVPDQRALARSRAASTLAPWGLSKLADLFEAIVQGERFPALRISFAGPDGQDVTELHITANQPLTLRVNTAAADPYDGFVQRQVSEGEALVWTDTRGYPIYIHNGAVELLPEAYKPQPGATISFAFRQQLTGPQIAADLALTERAQPSNEAEPFSNMITLTIE